MTRSELIDALSEKIKHFSRKDIEVIVGTLFHSIAEGLAKGDKIERKSVV